MKKEVDGNDEDVEAERKTSRLKGITQPKKLSTILSLDFVGSSNFSPLPPPRFLRLHFLSFNRCSLPYLFYNYWYFISWDSTWNGDLLREPSEEVGLLLYFPHFLSRPIYSIIFIN